METPDLNSIDAEWMLHDMIRQNRLAKKGGGVAAVMRMSLYKTFATATGEVTISRELILTPEEVLQLLSERKARN